MAARTLTLAALAAGLAAVPAPAQHGGTYYPAHTHAGRYYPAGHYTYSGGQYYHNGQVCHGYACESDYHAKVVLQKQVLVLPDAYYAASPYQPPQAPAAAPAQPDSRDRLLEALVLGQQQQTQFLMQMQGLMLLQQRGGITDPAAPAPALPQFQPIPPAAPAKAAAPKKAGLEGFVAAHCVSCHGPNAPKGNLDLSDLGKLTRDQWEECYDRMWCDKDMPPAGKPQPTDAELKAIRPEMRQRKLAAK